jgi:hypothetical protein
MTSGSTPEEARTRADGAGSIPAGGTMKHPLLLRLYDKRWNRDEDPLGGCAIVAVLTLGPVVVLAIAAVMGTGELLKKARRRWSGNPTARN